MGGQGRNNRHNDDLPSPHRLRTARFEAQREAVAQDGDRCHRPVASLSRVAAHDLAAFQELHGRAQDSCRSLSDESLGRVSNFRVPVLPLLQLACPLIKGEAGQQLQEQTSDEYFKLSKLKCSIHNVSRNRAPALIISQVSLVDLFQTHYSARDTEFHCENECRN